MNPTLRELTFLLANLEETNLRGADLDEKLHIELNEKYPHFTEIGKAYTQYEKVKYNQE